MSQELNDEKQPSWEERWASGLRKRWGFLTCCVAAGVAIGYAGAVEAEMRKQESIEEFSKVVQLARSTWLGDKDTDFYGGHLAMKSLPRNEAEIVWSDAPNGVYCEDLVARTHAGVIDVDVNGGPVKSLGSELDKTRLSNLCMVTPVTVRYVIKRKALLR